MTFAAFLSVVVSMISGLLFCGTACLLVGLYAEELARKHGYSKDTSVLMGWAAGSGAGLVFGLIAMTVLGVGTLE